MADKELVHKGSHISLYRQKVDLPNEKHTYYDVVAHPGGAVMAAVNENHQVCLITQSRPAVGGEIWEFPAGCLEPDEPPIDTAKRELEEETGFVAKTWHDLGVIVSTPGFCDERLYLFVATELTETATNFDDEEHIETHWLNVAEVEKKVANGEINDAKTLSLLYKMRSHSSFKHLWVL